MRHKGKWLLLSLLLAAGTSFVLLQLLKQKASVDVSAPPKTQVVVAVSEVPDHETLQSSMLRLQTVSTDSVPPGAIHTLSEAEQAVTLQRIVPGEILQKAMIVKPKQPGSLFAMKVPPGKRAVSISNSEVIGVGGLLQPGDHVDVLFGMKKEELNSKSDMAKMTLQNIEVLAVGGQSRLEDTVPPKSGNQSQGAASSGTVPKTTVTLAVTPEQAESLVYADLYGSIRLALRGVDDTGTASTNGVTGETSMTRK